MNVNMIPKAIMGFALLAATTATPAADKSAARSEVVTLPSAGGTVDKEGGSFAMNGNTGAANLSVPLPPLPTRTGHAPRLALNYSQFAGDSGGGLGIGWSISSSSIDRDTEMGTAIRRQRSNGDEYNTLTLDGQKLVYLFKSGEDVHYALESSAEQVSIVRKTDVFSVDVLGPLGELETREFPSGFVVTYPNGMKHVYSGQLDQAEGDFTNTDAPFFTRWVLALEIQPNGNAIAYQYRQAGGRSYLSEVVFAGGRSRYTFEFLESRGSVVNFRNSFEQRNELLYSAVVASFDDQPRAHICFAYLGRDTQNPAERAIRASSRCAHQAGIDLAQEKAGNSLGMFDSLMRIYRYGSEETFHIDAARLPTIKLRYSDWTSQDVAGRPLVYAAPALDAFASSEPGSLELADINRDALVDVVRSTAHGLTQVHWGEGSLVDSFAASSDWELASKTSAGTMAKLTPRLADPRFHFADISGDSYVDVVEVRENALQIYLNTPDGRYPAHPVIVPVPGIGPAAFEDGLTRFLDLDKDGYTDILTSVTNARGQRVWQIHQNRSLLKRDGTLDLKFSAPFIMPMPFAEHDLSHDMAVLGNQATKIVDVTGDGLPDLIEIRGLANGQRGFCLYENTGDIFNVQPDTLLFGRKGLQDVSCGQGRFVTIGGLKASDRVEAMWIIDVNGDGVADFANMGARSDVLQVWLGAGDGKFLPAPVIFPLNLHIAAGDAANFQTRIADIDGDGQEEIVVFQPGGGPETPPVAIVDFNRTPDNQLVKSNLLTTVEFESGLRHDVKYVTSIDELLRDRAKGIAESSLHFPVVLAKQIMTSDVTEANQRTNVSTVEMLYHHPYHHPDTRRFLGFGSIEKINYGDEHVLDERNIFQPSSYRRDDYYIPKTTAALGLAGKLKSSMTATYAPAGTFANEVDRSSRIDLARPAVEHSLSSYAREQSLPVPGQVLARTSSIWDVVPLGPNLGASFVRQMEERKEALAAEPEAGTSDRHMTKTLYRDYDAYNIPHVVRTESEAVQGPHGIAVPARIYESRKTYDESRLSLQDLGIVSLPSTELTVLVGDGQGTDETLLASVSHRYDAQSGWESGTTERVESDLSGLPSTLADQIPARRELITTVTRDGFGNVIKTTDNLGARESLIWDETGVLVTSNENALHHKTVVTYDRGFPIHYVTPTGLVYSVELDSLGRVIRTTGSDGSEVRHRYRMGRHGKPSLILSSRRRYADGASIPDKETMFVQTLTAYSPAGTSLGVAENNETGGVRIYDRVKQNRNNLVGFVFDPYAVDESQVEQIFEAGELPERPGVLKGIRKTYDALGRPISATASDQQISTVTYHPWGSVSIERYVDRGWQAGVVKRVQDGDAVIAIIDELGHTQRFSHSAAGFMVGIQLAGETRPRTIKRNNLGWMDSQHVPGVGSFYYSRDDRGQLLKEWQFDSQGQLTHTLESTYDALGRTLTVKTDGRLTAEHFYDAYPANAAAPVSRYENHALVKPVGMQTQIKSFDHHGLFPSTRTFAYSLAGYLVATSVAIGNETYTESQHPLLDGSISRSTDPFGVEKSFKFGPSSRFAGLSVYLPWAPEQEEPIVTGLSFNSRGQLLTARYRNGLNSTVTYNEQTRLPERVRTGSASQVYQDLETVFNGRGDVIAIEDRLASSQIGLVGRSAAFFYDKRRQLIQSQRFNETLNYGYTPAGAFVQNGEYAAGTLTVKGNEQTGLVPASDSIRPYAFDAAGNLISGGKVLAARFDAQRHLVYAKTEAGEVYLGYDASGLRIYRRVVTPNGTRDSFYPFTSAIIEQGEKQSHVLFNGGRFARIDHVDRKLFYYLKDHLGSSDIMVTAAGDPVEQMLYRPYGTELDPKIASPAWASHVAMNAGLLPSQPTVHRHTGHYLDIDLGIYDHGARHYDPALGRYLSPDPRFLENPETCARTSLVECNLYSYGANNPLTYTDPTGMEVKLEVVAKEKVAEGALSENCTEGKGACLKTMAYTLEPQVSTSGFKAGGSISSVKLELQSQFSGQTAKFTGNLIKAEAAVVANTDMIGAEAGAQLGGLKLGFENEYGSVSAEAAYGVKAAVGAGIGKSTAGLGPLKLSIDVLPLLKMMISNTVGSKAPMTFEFPAHTPPDIVNPENRAVLQMITRLQSKGGVSPFIDSKALAPQPPVYNGFLLKAWFMNQKSQPLPLIPE